MNRPGILAATVEVDKLAHQLAYVSAESAIDCHSITEQEGSLDWMNIEGSEDLLVDDIRYLELRGLLTRHPQRPLWIAIRLPEGGL